MCVIGISVSFAAWPTSAVRCRFRLVVLAMSVCRINQLLTRLIVCGHCCVCVCTPAIHCPQMSDCNVTKGVWRVHSSIQQFCSDLCLWPTGSTVLAHCQWQQDELRLRLKQLAARFSYLCTSKTAEVHSMLRRLVIKIRLHHFGAFVTFMISLRRIQMFLLTYLLTSLMIVNWSICYTVVVGAGGF